MKISLRIDQGLRTYYNGLEAGKGTGSTHVDLGDLVAAHIMCSPPREGHPAEGDGTGDESETSSYGGALWLPFIAEPIVHDMFAIVSVSDSCL